MDKEEQEVLEMTKEELISLVGKGRPADMRDTPFPGTAIPVTSNLIFINNSLGVLDD